MKKMTKVKCKSLEPNSVDLKCKQITKEEILKEFIKKLKK
jgi:hypothetical protein